MKRFITILFLLTSIVYSSNNTFYNVVNFGAKGDSKTLDTKAINNAIDEASKKGGGTIFFPAGNYLSGSIRLKSNITLKLDAGARILSAPNGMNAFDHPEELAYEKYQDFGHSTWRNALIWGGNLENIAIIGRGVIDGSSMTSGDAAPGDGEKAIALKLCRNILIRDITILNAGHFAILPTGCNNMTIDNLLVDTNRDGINVDCCKNVRITNCTINSDDDALCLKSSFALNYAQSTEDVTITNCLLSGYETGSVYAGKYLDEGPFFARGYDPKGVGSDEKSQHNGGSIKRIGRIKFGTESNGGFKNITISNCTFEYCWGLALETVDGAVIENINISNIAMKNIVDAPIFIRLGDRARGPEGTKPGIIRNIIIDGLTATVQGNRYGCMISGLPGHLIENITLSNITIVSAGGGKLSDADREVPENEHGGPEPTMFGDMPSYGFFIRHARDVFMTNICLQTENTDLRPAIYCDDVHGLNISNLNVDKAKGAKPIIFKKNSSEIKEIKN